MAKSRASGICPCISPVLSRCANLPRMHQLRRTLLFALFLFRPLSGSLCRPTACARSPHYLNGRQRLVACTLTALLAERVVAATMTAEPLQSAMTLPCLPRPPPAQNHLPGSQRHWETSCSAQGGSGNKTAGQERPEHCSNWWRSRGIERGINEGRAAGPCRHRADEAIAGVRSAEGPGRQGA